MEAIIDVSARTHEELQRIGCHFACVISLREGFNQRFKLSSLDLVLIFNVGVLGAFPQGLS